ncbi:hypothetical protein [Pseudonocardia sp. ICBG601]|uniref:hypothetical protein n=1 Tax=Pseudonocardia sp. ICBG601 TaxID=2846759 RepID=UPI001CF6FA2A|nr:hypothetical protein [Pseudonocardia sp. ICBG601]
MSRPQARVRAAVPADARGIAEVCTRAYRATYRDLLPEAFVDDVVARFYDETRVRSEIVPAPPHWLGYVVAEEAGTVVGAAGGAITADGVGELYVLYRARAFVERDRVPMHTSAADDDLWSLRMHRGIARSSRQS